MTDPQAVLAARALIARADEEERNQRRADLIRQLAQVRTEHRAATVRYRSLSAQIKAGRQSLAQAQLKVQAAFHALDEHSAARPSVADYLPDDPDVLRWTEAHAALEGKCDELILLRDALPDPDRDLAEACAFEGAYGTIAVLEFSESNLVRALERVEQPLPREISVREHVHAADGVK
jgi:hypothetical protein